MIRKRNSNKNIYKLNQLNTAIVINDMNTIMELLENHIDLNAPDAHGWYPIMYAVEYGNVEVMKLLSKKYYPNQYLLIKELLQHGIDINIISNTGKTALYLARLNHPRYINMLKRYGAEI